MSITQETVSQETFTHEAVTEPTVASIAQGARQLKNTKSPTFTAVILFAGWLLLDAALFLVAKWLRDESLADQTIMLLARIVCGQCVVATMWFVYGAGPLAERFLLLCTLIFVIGVAVPPLLPLYYFDEERENGPLLIRFILFFVLGQVAFQGLFKWGGYRFDEYPDPKLSRYHFSILHLLEITTGVALLCLLATRTNLADLILGSIASLLVQVFVCIAFVLVIAPARNADRFRAYLRWIAIPLLSLNIVLPLAFWMLSLQSDQCLRYIAEFNLELLPVPIVLLASIEFFRSRGFELDVYAKPVQGKSSQEILRQYSAAANRASSNITPADRPS